MTAILSDVAAMLRLEAARNPHDPDLVELIGEFSLRSEVFRQRWASNDVRLHRSGTKRFGHPAVGRPKLSFESVTLESAHGMQRNIYPATPGTSDPDASGRWRPGPPRRICRSLRPIPAADPGSGLPPAYWETTFDELH